MHIRLATAAILITAFAAGCKQDEKPTPVTPAFQPEAVFNVTRRFQNSPIMGVDSTYAVVIGFARFYAYPGANGDSATMGIFAGNVQLNGSTCEYIDGTYIRPSDFLPVSTSIPHWQVAGSGSITPFEYLPTGPFPTITPDYPSSVGLAIMRPGQDLTPEVTCSDYDSLVVDFTVGTGTAPLRQVRKVNRPGEPMVTFKAAEVAFAVDEPEDNVWDAWYYMQCYKSVDTVLGGKKIRFTSIQNSVLRIEVE